MRSHSRRRPLRPAMKGEILLDEATARRVRLRRFRRVFAAVLALALVLSAIGIYLSPFLRVQRVEVVGASQVNPAEIEARVSLEGDSMLHLDMAGSRERIEMLTLVDSVRIERRWPQTVRIIVNERQPWGYWQVGETYYPIDPEGIVLATTKPLEGVPTIVDLSNPVRLVPGDHVDADAVALAQELAGRVPESLALNISLFEYTTGQGLALVTDAGYRVVFGDSQEVEYKLAVWRAIEEQLGRESISGHVLDLRFRDRPALSLSNGPSSP